MDPEYGLFTIPDGKLTWVVNALELALAPVPVAEP
jgi:hypothetical protein